MSKPVKLKCQSCGSEHEVMLCAGDPLVMFCYSCAMALDNETYGNISYVAHEAKAVRTVYADLFEDARKKVETIIDNESEAEFVGNVMSQILD